MTLYVVGDVHGRLDLLRQMDEQISQDIAGQWPFVVLVGDVVDRGPDSAQVLDHLIQRSRDERFICLRGNHEELMAQFVRAPRSGHPWLGLGGRETLESYGLAVSHLGTRDLASKVRSHVPPEHIEFLENAPICVETERAFVSHAGIRPGVPFSHQRDRDLLWFRDEMAASLDEYPKFVIHGHDPAPNARIHGNRVNVDTGAYASGVLTAARVDQRGLHILSVSAKKLASSNASQ